MRRSAKDKVRALIREAESEGGCCVARDRRETKQLCRAAQEGVAYRIHSGVYVLPESWNAWSVEERALHAARGIQKCHPNWVAAGPTAALFHSLAVGHRWLFPLTFATDRSAHAQADALIRRIIVSGDKPVERQDVQVTSFLRTVYDCLRTLPFCDALAIADSALRTKNITRERLANGVRKGCGNRPGMRRALDIIALADGRSESGGESIARAKMMSLGFATPDLQRVFHDTLEAGKEFRADFAWELKNEGIIIGELDGKEKYTNPEMTRRQDVSDILLAERRREAHLTLGEKPVRIMRFSYAEAIDTERMTHLLTSYGVPRTGWVPLVARE